MLILPFFLGLCFGLLYTLFLPSVKLTGQIARAAIIAALALAQRNSVITLLIGMPIDRAIFYHKITGKLAFFTGLMHTMSYFLDPKMPHYSSRWDAVLSLVENRMNTSGTYMMYGLLGIAVTSMPYIRRNLFEVFYYLHAFFVVGITVGAFFHTGILVPCLAALTWGVDLVIRKVVMAGVRYPMQGRIKVISDTVVELSFPKVRGFDFNPGQYIYVAVPELSFMEFHPFSISSSPKQRTVVSSSFLVRIIEWWASMIRILTLEFTIYFASDDSHSKGRRLDQSPLQTVQDEARHKYSCRRPVW